MTSDDGLADDGLVDDGLVGGLMTAGGRCGWPCSGRCGPGAAETELELGAPQRRAVLGLLAARANQAVSRDELIDGIWATSCPPDR